jgi:hypothetical protein
MPSRHANKASISKVLEIMEDRKKKKKKKKTVLTPGLILQVVVATLHP